MKINKISVVVIFIMLLVLSACTVFLYKLNIKVETMNVRVGMLESQISNIRFIKEGKIFSDKCQTHKYNALVIGNSITKHGKCDYWWGDYGMAASELNKDYFHILDQMFKSGG